jgi:hypothetical protein
MKARMDNPAMSVPEQSETIKQSIGNGFKI